jgi:hypothetical protein
MEKHSLRELIGSKKALLHGRTASIINNNKVGEDVKDGSVVLFWTGSALEFNVTGSLFNIELYSDYDVYEQWISVYVNGAFIQRLMLPKGNHVVECYRNMNPENVKNVRIVKEVQAMSDDKSALLLGVSAETDGEFEDISERDLKLEFIGDSITSGEGCVGAKPELDWISMFFGASFSYSFMTAKALNADYRVFSQSGWGLLCGWDGNPYHSLTEHYTKVCSLLSGDKQKACGSANENDSESWQPDAVILNLGTNDYSAFTGPEWKGEDGETFNLKLNEDGSFEKNSKALWISAADRFIRIIREKNPKARIIWVFGMLGNGLVPLIQETLDNYTKATGDNNVSLVLVPDTNDETVGSRMHPGVKEHEIAADLVIKEIRKFVTK